MIIIIEFHCQVLKFNLQAYSEITENLEVSKLVFLELTTILVVYCQYNIELS